MSRSRQRRARIAVVAVPLALLALPTASPAGQISRGATPSGSAASQRDQVQRFGATVARVRVDVIVTDGDGEFVTDLGAEDFVLYEDGERQEILDVQLVDLAAGEVHPLMGDQRAVAVRSGGEAVSRRNPAAPPGGETSAGGADANGDSPLPSAASELGAVIFLIDGPSLNVQTRARFGDAWRELLAQTDSLQVPRAAYMVDSVGQLQELAPLGYDLGAMRAAADTVRDSSFFGDMTRQRLIEVANDLNTPGIDAEVAQRIAAAKVRSFEGQERSRSLATYELLTSFADALWTRPGRTAVVWVSTGIKLMQGGPYTALIAQSPASGGSASSGTAFDRFSPDPTIKAAQEALHRAANGSNVSFYAVDPSLLTGTRAVGADVEVGSAAAASVLGSREVEQSLDGLRDALRTAAAETGGRSFVHATDLGVVLEEIERDTARFYLLTYAPPERSGDGEFHAIEVEVARDDVDVRARGGYVDHPPAERAERLIEAALALPGSVTDLPVEAQLFRSRPAADAPNALLAVAVDGSEVGIMLTQRDERRVSLDIHALVLRGDQPVAESHEQLTARATDDGSFRADSENPLTPTLVGYFAYQHEWTLEPGAYTVNVAAFDNVTGRIGATSLAVDIPEPDAGWGISDPLLVTVDDAGRVQPVVLGRVIPGQSLAAFVEVYGGIQPILSGQVLRDARDDEPQQGAKLFPMPLRRVAASIHRGSAPLPPGMPPGNYVLQLVVTDPPAEQHRIVRLPIEVVAPPRR